MAEKKEVNFKRMGPPPSSPGAKIISVDENKLMVGSSESKQSIAGLKNMVPEGKK